MTGARPGRDRILVWMCAMIAINQLGFGSVVPVLALYARSFGVPQSAIGLAIAIYGLARFLVAVPVGQLADRIGRRGALALGGLVTALGNLLCAWRRPIPRSSARASSPGPAPPSSSPRDRSSSPTSPRRPIAGGRWRSTRACSSSPSASARFRAASSPSASASSAPFFVYAVAGRARRRPRVAPGAGDEELARARTEAGDAPPFAAQLRLLAGHRGFMLVSLVSFINAVARTGALFNVVPVLAHDRLALATDRIGVGLALASVVGLAFAYPAGVLVDRYGRKIVIVPSTILAGLSLVIFVWRRRTPGSSSPAWRGAWPPASAAPRRPPTPRTWRRPG